MPGAQVKRDDEYLSVQIPVPNPQKVTYISAIKGMFHDIRNRSRSNSDLDGRVHTAKAPLADYLTESKATNIRTDQA